MAYSFVQINEGGGKRLAHNLRNISAVDYYEQTVGIAEPSLPTFNVAVTTAVSLSVANEHILQLFAGSTNRFSLRRLKVTQVTGVTGAQTVVWQILRLSSAGTGGTSYTPRTSDPGDSAVPDTAAMVRPTAKGTESFVLWTESVVMWQTLPTNAVPPPLIDLQFDNDRSKGFEAAAGAGLALKNITAAASAAATVHIFAQFVERNWN